MKIRKKSVRQLWFWSYFIVMLIPIITVIINYSLNVRSIKAELVRTNELSLNHVKERIDNLLVAEKELYSFAFLDENYENLRYVREMDSHFYYVASLLHGNLALYRNGIDNMSCIVYLEDADYLITNSNTGSAERYYKTRKYDLDNVLGYDVWKAILSRDYRDKYFIGQGVSSLTNEKCLVYANTINNGQKGKQNFFVSIPLTAIEEILEYFSDDSWFIMKIDEETTVFYDGHLTDVPEGFDEDKDFGMLSVDSAEDGVSYQHIFSKKNMRESLEDMRRNFWLSLSITLVFGVTGIAFLLNYNYRPLHSLLKEIDEKVDDFEQRNEFERLKDNYIQLRKEKHDSQILVVKQKEELQKAWLLMLMKGRTIKWQEKDTETYLGLTLSGCIALVGFMIPIEQGDFQYEELKFFIVDNIFSELMKDVTFYHIEDGGFIFYLFDLSPDLVEEWRRDAKDKVEFVCKMLIEKFKMPIIGVISDIGENVFVIKSIYQEVMNAFEYGSVAGIHEVIDVRELPNYNELNLLKDYMNKEFREAFLAKDVSRACAVSEKLFTGHGVASLTLAKVRVYEAFIVVVDIFKEYVNDAVQQEKAIGYLEMLIGEENIEAIKMHFNELLQFLINEISCQQMMQNKVIINKIVKYIEANYMNCNLNLNFIAEDLQKNSRYLSRVFKEEKKLSILDYINSYRIMKAKELIQSREYTMEEIARKVGYGDIRTFRRAFVNITGELPSVYVDNFARTLIKEKKDAE